MITFSELLKILVIHNIKVDVVEGQLSIQAAKDTLSSDLIKQLKVYKQELIDYLSANKSSAGQSNLLQIIPDKKNLYQCFPFSDLQVAFYMAGDPYMEFHVKPHYYNEVDRTNFDVKRYEQAINLVFQRHKGDVVLVVENSELQVLDPLPPVNCKINDFRGQSKEQRESSLISVRGNMMRKELPLERWPWIIFEISIWEEEGILCARIHSNSNNFYLDGVSFMVLYKEIEAFYENPQTILAPLDLTYRDAVLGLQKLSESPEGQQAKKYWLDRLPGLPDPPALPQLSGINRKSRSQLQRREKTLPPSIWQGIKHHAKTCGLTPSSVIITAYAEVLSMWCGSQHFVLSNMASRRLPIHAEINDIIGNLASLYPLEIDLRGDLSFFEKAKRVQKQILTDAENRYWGGTQVMQAFNQLKGEFGSAPCPFVVSSVLFVENYKKPTFSCLETAQVILDHQFWELEDGSYFYVWDLLEELFPNTLIDSMWETIDSLLRQLGEDSKSWNNKTLTLAPIAFFENHNRGIPVPTGLLQQGLSYNTKRRGDSTFLDLPSGQYTYQDLDTLSDKIAEGLKGVDSHLIAIAMDRTHYLVAAALAVLKAGAAYVPIDPALPNERMLYLLRNTEVDTILTQEKYYQKVNRVCNDEPQASVNVIDVERESCLSLASVTKPNRTAIESDLAYVIYTSGSTGQPKGVMIDHRGALNTVRDINQRFGITHKDKIFGASSFSFDLSVYDIFGTLDTGASLVYPEPTAAYNPAHWLELLQSKKVTVWNSAPPLMTLLLETALRQQVVLPNLRLVMLSGDWIPLELYGQLCQLAPNAELISLGGATEASIWSIYFPVKKLDPQWKSIPYGKPLANQGWQIRDHLGRQVPLWVIGELFITGVGLAKGYWKDKEKTEKSFIVDKSTGERLYRTGDLGRYLPDGNIEFMGRADSQVKIQGYRIELGEIESVLMKHENVKNAIVLAEALTGDSPRHEKQLVGFIILKEKNTIANVSVNDKGQNPIAIKVLKGFLEEKIPTYMVPSSWAFLSEIPLTANGKVDRKKLLTIERSNSRTHNMNNDRESIAPRNPTEEILSSIWKDLLSIQHLSVYDDFFALGGRSFDAVRCISLIKEKLACDLTLGDIWEKRTIDKLAEYIQNASEYVEKKLTCLKKLDNSQHQCFMIHPGGGQIIGYYPLAEQLDCSSYAICATAQDVKKGDLLSVEHIASRYNHLVLQQQATGPYTLIGWSSGSYIAFEMAWQLEQQGKVVGSVYIIDAPAPTQHQAIETIEMCKHFFEDLGLGLAVETIDTLSLSEGSEEERFSHICHHFNHQQSITLDARQLYPMFCVFTACVNASRCYDPLCVSSDKLSSENFHPKKINGNLFILRAREGLVTEFSTHSYQQQLDWGWAHLSRSQVQAISLPGTHHTVLQAPNVKQMSEYINRYLPNKLSKSVVDF